MAGFKHGAYTSEVPTALLPSVTVDSNVVFAVGTAAVDKLAEGTTKYINKPRMYYSYDEFVTEMGWDSDNFGKYTLQELIHSHFALYRGAPVVAVNVFDPKKHKTSVGTENVTFIGSEADLAHGSVMNLRLTSQAQQVTSNEEASEEIVLVNGVGHLTHTNVSGLTATCEVDGESVSLEESTDFVLDAATGTITRVAEGQIPSATETLSVTYQYQAVTSSSQTYVEGVDYEVNVNTGALVLVEGGSISANATVTASYDYADVSKVSYADIIGGINADGESLGLELIDAVFPMYRKVPGSILCPQFSEVPAVAVVMAAKSHDINGLFQAIAIADIPSDGTNGGITKYTEVPAVAVVMAAKSHDINGLFQAIAIADIPSDGTNGGITKYTEVPAYKQNNNLVDEHLIVCWPKVKLGDNVYGLATHLTGLMSQTDHNHQDIPYASASNKGLNITSIGLVDTDGSWKELGLGMEKVNYLNGEGIYSALNWTGGLRSWGGRMSSYPGNTDPKDCQEPIRRMFNWYRNTFILTYFQKVDEPMTRRFIQTILRSENIKLEGYTSREIILGGRITFVENENAVTDLIDGIVRFHLYITPPPAAREIDCSFEFDTDYLSVLFS